MGHPKGNDDFVQSLKSYFKKYEILVHAKSTSFLYIIILFISPVIKQTTHMIVGARIENNMMMFPLCILLLIIFVLWQISIHGDVVCFKNMISGLQLQEQDTYYFISDLGPDLQFYHNSLLTLWKV